MCVLDFAISVISALKLLTELHLIYFPPVKKSLIFIKLKSPLLLNSFTVENMGLIRYQGSAQRT